MSSDLGEKPPARPSPKKASTRSHRGPKLRLESIHVDELIKAAGMSGYLSVLDPPTPPPPHLKELAREMLAEYQTRDDDVPGRYQTAIQSGDTETGTPEKGIPEIGIPEVGVHTIGVPVSGTPKTSTPFPSIIDSSRTQRKYVVRPATVVQDGHSLGEQLVYQTLWDRAQPHDTESRIICIGYRTLSDACRLTVNNCKANLLSLAQKLSIRLLSGHSPAQSKTYQILNYNAILRLRRQAGLTHVIRTRGVVFVNPIDARPIILKGVPESGIPFIQTGVPESGSSGVPFSATPSLDINLRQTPSHASSSSFAEFPKTQAAVEKICGPVDDDALRLLISTCLANDYSITDADLSLLVQIKAARLRSLAVRNPVGWLLTAVPKMLTGQGRERLLPRLRELESVRQPTEADTEALKLDLRRLLAAPTSTDEDRSFAEAVLADLV